MKTRTDYRDTVIETLADSEAALREQVKRLAERAVLAEAERDAYRLLSVQGLHYVHRLQGELATMTERYHRALDHTRALREEMRSEKAANGSGVSRRVAA